MSRALTVSRVRVRPEDHGRYLAAVRELADLAERLGIGRDHQLVDAAAQRLGVEPFGDRRAVRQLVDVGAAVALAGRVLVAHAGAEVGLLDEQHDGLRHAGDDAGEDYVRRCFGEYGFSTDPSGRYSAMYKDGWTALREARAKRAAALGIVAFGIAGLAG